MESRFATIVKDRLGRNPQVFSLEAMDFHLDEQDICMLLNCVHTVYVAREEKNKMVIIQWRNQVTPGLGDDSQHHL